jgi:hypothetical protein
VPRSALRIVASAAAIVLLALAALPVMAAGEPVLRGRILDADGNPFPVESARMTLIAPDGGGSVASKFEVAEDGSFEVALMPWGSVQAPAQVRIDVTGAVTSVVVDDEGCSEQFAPLVQAVFPVALESGSDPEPVELIGREVPVGTVCGNVAAPGTTLPPTDVNPELLAAVTRQATVVAALGAIGFLAGITGVGAGR